MNIFYTPEQALSELLRYLNDDVLVNTSFEEVIPAGSVPLGLYVDERPDLDIFIVVSYEREIPLIMKTLRKTRTFQRGLLKEGELDIWFVPDYKGYPLDLVVISKENEKVQTLNHVKYYRDIMTDEFAERVRWLKIFFKDINCYGAETGGITGICCTRMGETYEDTDALLSELANALMGKGHIFIEDPTLKGRDLFASVQKIKKRIMIKEISKYFHNGERNVDFNTFFEDYRRVYRVKRKKGVGTDKEWQFVYSCIRKTWREMKNAIKLWRVTIEYDTLVTPYDIYIGIKIEPDIIEDEAFEHIPMKVFKDNEENENVQNLMKKGAYLSKDKETLIYPKNPPFKNVSREFERNLLDKLHEKYKVERE